MSAHLLRLNRRVLAVFLFVSLPTLIFGVVLVLSIGQQRLLDNYGQHLEDIARQTAASVDAYVYRRIVDVSLVARSPELRRAAATASTRALAADEVQKTDEQWMRRGDESPQKAELLRNAPSRYLADLVAHDRTYRELLLTDRQGRLVAASNETTDYFQADEDWWKAAAGEDRAPGVSVTDVRWDDSTRTYAVEVAVPVFDPEGGTFAGLLKGVLDSRELLATVGGVQLGATGEAVLLRPNGTVVFSRQTSDPNARYFGQDANLQELATVGAAGPESGAWFRTTPPSGQVRLVGLAASQLSRSYPNVAWVVAVSQAEEELLVPVRALGWYLLAVVGLTVLALLVAAVYLSVRLAAPQLEEDLRLVEHARVSHVGDEEEESDTPPSPRMVS